MCLTSSPNCLCTSITGKISMAPTPLLAKGNGTLARKWRKIKKRCSSFSSGDSLSRSKSEDRSSHCGANGLSNFSSHSHKVSDVECSTDDLRTHSRDHSVSILLDFISTITITNEANHSVSTLLTQPMLHRRLNRTELRSMNSYIQILCRFQKCKRKVPPPSLLSNEKSPFTPPKEDFPHPLGG